MGWVTGLTKEELLTLRRNCFDQVNEVDAELALREGLRKMTITKKQYTEHLTKEVVKKIDTLFIEDEVNPLNALLILPSAGYCLSLWLELEGEK